MAKNTFKPPVEPAVEEKPAERKEDVVEQAEPKKKKKAKKENSPKGNSGNILRGILDGSILTKKFVIQSIPMILLLVFLGIIFIANRYTIETTSLKINSLKKDLEQLRNLHIQMKNKYEQVSSITEIEKSLDSTGVKQSKERPQKIVIKEIK